MSKKIVTHKTIESLQLSSLRRLAFKSIDFASSLYFRKKINNAQFSAFLRAQLHSLMLIDSDFNIKPNEFGI